MKRLPMLVQVLIAGLVAGLVVRMLFVVFDEGGIFQMLTIPMQAPPDLVRWLAERLAWDMVFALLFLVPLLRTREHVMRGLVVGWAPALKLLVWDFPAGGLGLAGLALGIGVPFFAIFFSLLWGALAGWLLNRMEFMPPLPDEDEVESTGG